ncbi:Protein cereblon [Hirschfeldia incana]|nr:Protein cereblon [Hirschfeldia incana]
MEDEERILARERLQMEQIRELDFEELQVEEVDDFRDSDDDDDLAAFRPISHARLSDNIGADDVRILFNPDVASLHTYLGEVEETPNRTAFVDGGTVLKIPLFYLEGVVLFPESTLPLRIVQSSFLAAIERALNQTHAPSTIGVIRVYREGHQFKYASVGTTAEIRQYRRLSDGSFNVITRGQQRFLLKRRWTDVEGFPCGEAHIVEEDVPLRTPRDAFGKLVPISNLRAPSHSSTMPLSASFRDTDELSVANSEESFESALSPSEKRLHYSAVDSIMDDWTSSDDDQVASTSNIQSSGPNPFSSSSVGSLASRLDEQSADAKTPVSKGICQKQNLLTSFRKNTDLNRFRMAPRAFWPFWVYRMYDSYHLAQRAADLWKQIVGVPNMEAIVNKPDILSFFIASKIPVSESIRQELLEIDGVSYRLQREIELLERFDRVRCKHCQIVIARRSDMLVMSSDGPLGAYVNPHGFVHEIMTFYKANDIAISGRSVKEDSWFPGYAWTIANCATCETQLGWLFTATSKKLKPSSFWAVRSSQVADDMR